VKKNEFSERIGFFSRCYAFNRHVRLSAYSKMFPEAKLVLFTTNLMKDIKKWKGVKNLEIVELKPTIMGYLGLIKYCRKNKLKYLSNLGHPKSFPIILLNKIINGTKFICFRGRLKEYLWEYLFSSRFADKIMVNDLELYENMKHSKYRNKAYYLPAPTDTDFYVKKDRKSIRKKLKLPLNKKIVISVGRVSEHKGSDFLYNAIKSNKDILFVVIGAIVDKRFNDLNSPNYLYLGTKESSELVDYFNAADLGLFVILIDGGGLAMTAHECLSCGTPIIVADRKRKNNCAECIILSKESVEGVNENIRKFFSDKRNEGNEIREMSRDFAINRCSMKKWKNEYRKVFLDKR
jgi:glycosyltransferase involved in cell wall biosynthesis